MAETLSPQRQRVTTTNRIQSPPSPYVLGSNDDKLERAQSRAARAALIRRKIPPIAPFLDPTRDSVLGKQQILDLFHNCIKLASENKINQKNTWELELIDHLCEIIKVEEEDDTETNFQKASCTLEAGVKIYSMRVDSVHSEAYKVLGGINRAGQDDDHDINTENTIANNGLEGLSKKGMDKKMTPLSTLESSFEALNVKKFDVAFAVDPLYHQTSAQFDEGGAKGLLLNNVGIYGECRVLFDSLEVPAKCITLSNSTQQDKTNTIDLSFISECVEKMVSGMLVKNEISPTLNILINKFDEDNRRPLHTFSSGHKLKEQVFASHNDEAEWNGDADQNCVQFDDQASVVDEDFNYTDPFVPPHEEETEQFGFQSHDVDDRFGKVDGYLILGLGFTSKQNAWAGPDHWKYRKAECLETGVAKENETLSTVKKSRSKKHLKPDIDFTKAWDKDLKDIFIPPKNSKTLLLPANRPPFNATLPEDCHYQPENLVKLFLLPNIMCLGRRARKPSDEARQEWDDQGAFPSWDDQNEFGGEFDDGGGHTDVEDSSMLVSQPRQVNKIEVQYDKTSKVVDVQALKEILWDCIQEFISIQRLTLEGKISFKQIVASIPDNCRASTEREDISPHLCFICLLHLANEHGLSIHGCTDMNELNIGLPQ